MTTQPKALQQELCFLFYVASKEVIKKFSAYLKEYELTYTGYITLISIADDEVVNIKRLGDRIYLNSGTLTPLTKKLVAQGLIEKVRKPEDERNLNISLTDKGRALKQQLKHLNEEVHASLTMEEKDMMDLLGILQRFLENNFPCHTVTQ
ncbi:MarR family winged helix-turn-helix transcriptional regulator [Staphylococcus lutrae]|uniref:MarR family transcriptional regulator n=1 Tax=Staphylococcus lutrae TaxID=155085 RepID=A0AAC9RT16_9STAP|nr:MarR family transcriptional regulator [Staphylococcus lutrae]ARJ50619.1 MarR family transcriptional regulator [Staphylococcus lutrae]PNZ38806.1 MarR family transcriptional regulator [Staphylococcus lutrae]